MREMSCSEQLVLQTEVLRRILHQGVTTPKAVSDYLEGKGFRRGDISRAVVDSIADKSCDYSGSLLVKSLRTEMVLLAKTVQVSLLEQGTGG